ncbi:alpha/beta hydrolase [Phormidium tenue FACHB-886]|nr:alpha/beta hydrolase [Phormidium tenue FACHB-886]
MPYITIRGVDHYYEWIGTSGLAAEKPTVHKPTLVFIHGWAGSTRYWESTAQGFVDQFDCLVYDLRGFGRSRLPRPIPPEVEALGYELDSYADDLALLLEALHLDRISLNAHSTGSSVAVLFLNRYPEKVERAVLTCSGIFEYDEKAFAAFHKFGGYVVKFRPAWLDKIPGVEHMFMSRFLRRPIPKAAKRAFLEDYLLADQEAALGTVYTAVSKRAAEEMPQEFAQLTIPTLIISGEHDQIIQAELGQKAAALNDRIQHIVMAETGHFPMLEDPELYLQHARQFLQVKQAIG